MHTQTAHLVPAVGFMSPSLQRTTNDVDVLSLCKIRQVGRANLTNNSCAASCR